MYWENIVRDAVQIFLLEPCAGNLSVITTLTHVPVRDVAFKQDSGGNNYELWQ